MPFSAAELAGSGALLLFFIVGLHRLGLALAALGAARRPPSTEGARSELPPVLVQLPVYNERAVIDAAVEALARLDYPKDRLTIQILDDSTDDTSEAIAAALRRWQPHGIRIEHLRRAHRSGFKAGALAAGLAAHTASSAEELVAIFDADFTPPTDFLHRLVGEFADPRVGLVQARWTFRNRTASWLTAAQGLLLDGHFFNEHGGRAARQLFFNFNGTAGLWRRRCIESAGGWSGATLTEDLELSYRAQLAGWRFVFRPEVSVDSELPATADALKRQQRRWQHGALQTARLLLPAIWRSPVTSWAVRLEATAHLLGGLLGPLFLLSALLLPFLDIDLGWVGQGAAWLGTVAFVSAYAIAAVRGAPNFSVGLRRLLAIPAALGLGAGLAVGMSRVAFLECTGRGPKTFERTPKSGARAAIYRAPLDSQWILEVAVAALLAASFGVRGSGSPGATLGLLLLGGSAWLGIASIWPSAWPTFWPWHSRRDDRPILRT